MSNNANEVPWWFPDGSALVLLMFYLCMAIAIIATTKSVQSASYGVLLISLFFGGVTYFSIGLLLKYSRVVLSDLTGTFLRKRRLLLVLAATSAPVLASWGQNGSLAAALSPVDYWKSELRSAAEDLCGVQRGLFVNALEELRVTQKKQAMGIATTHEVMQSVETLKVINDVFQDCESNRQSRSARARARLNAIATQ
jgi:hypothetical protein